MGEIYEAACNCGYKVGLELGAGMNGCNYQFIKRLLDKPDADLFSEAFENGLIGRFVIENVPCFCDNCKSISSVFVLSYQLKTGQVVNVKGKCSHCKNSVRLLSKDSLACPKCGKKLKLEIVGHWD